MKFLKLGSLMTFATVVAFGFAGSAHAGTVILEGSDAIGFHCPQEGEASACLYTAQVWTALDGSSGLPIAVIDGSVPITIGSNGSGVTIDNFTSVAAAAAAGTGSLSQYAALYFEGDETDNGGPEGDTAIEAAGAQAAVTAYINGGGTIMIEDYDGGSAWDFAVGNSGSANGEVAGYLGGASVTSDVCDDGETVSALGTTNGFTQPEELGCWEHQAYNTAYFGGLTSINGSGFTLSFFDAAPGMVDGATTGWSGLLSDGVTLTGSTAAPEPSSFVLLALGLAGLALVSKKKLRTLQNLA